jgi:hypothetical protein
MWFTSFTDRANMSGNSLIKFSTSAHSSGERSSLILIRRTILAIHSVLNALVDQVNINWFTSRAISGCSVPGDIPSRLHLTSSTDMTGVSCSKCLSVSSGQLPSLTCLCLRAATHLCTPRLLADATASFVHPQQRFCPLENPPPSPSDTVPPSVTQFLYCPLLWSCCPPFLYPCNQSPIVNMPNVSTGISLEGP